MKEAHLGISNLEETDNIVKLQFVKLDCMYSDGQRYLMNKLANPHS